MFRVRNGQVEVLLVHPGGPFWARKDDGAWFTPKGEIMPGEEELAAAKREFREETGLNPTGDLIPLGSVRHKGGKVVKAWAFAGDCDPQSVVSNTFSMEWPPRSGRLQEFPEVDRAQFFTIDQAKRKLHPPEREFVERLAQICIDRGLVDSARGPTEPVKDRG